MFFSTYLFVATLLATVTATPVPQNIFPDDGIYRWKVTEFDSFDVDGLQSSNCPYELKVQGDVFNKDGLKTPAIQATCKGDLEGGPFVPCSFDDGEPAGRTVSTRLVKSTSDGALIVSYEFTDASKQSWNYTAKPAEVIYITLEKQTFNIEVPAPVKVGPQPS